MSEREREILHAELRGSTTEFLGWLTGMKPPEDKESIPPEMRAAFDRMVDRLVTTVERCAGERISSEIEACAKIADTSDRDPFAKHIYQGVEIAMTIRARAACAALTTSQRASE